MRPKPVRKYPQPKYPTRLEIAARPALLRRHQPPAWRQWPELTGAAGLFLLADATRLPGAASPPQGTPTPAQAKAVAVVAPIFEHGEGRGATGCIVMSPPVFLSEQEALQIIQEELGKLGVDAAQTNFVVPGVKITPAFFDFYTNEDKMRLAPASGNPLVASAADPRKKVAVEFVSQRNCSRLGAPASLSTVQSYDLKAVAASVAAAVREQGEGKFYFGTFYDPLADTWQIRNLRGGKSAPGAVNSNGPWASVQPTNTAPAATGAAPGTPPGPAAVAQPDSRRLLRLQVQDFIKWLQAQGAI